MQRCGDRRGRGARRSLGAGGCGVVIATALVMTGACGGPDTLVGGDVAFVDVDVIPMDAERLLEDQAVIIEDGRIVAIGSADEIGPEEGVPVIDGDGLYLLPGLTEMHAHLPHPRQSDIDIKNQLFLYVANGVTTVRSMQGDPSHFGLRDQIDRGLVVGPRAYLGSDAISGDSVQSPEMAEQRVREYTVAGYDVVNVREGLSVEAFDAVARTASALGIPFGGQVPHLVGLRRALASGQSSIDDLDNYVEGLMPVATPPESIGLGGALVGTVDDADLSVIPELVQATVDAGARVVPAMVWWETHFVDDRPSINVLGDYPEVVYMPPETVERWIQAVDASRSATEAATNRRVAALRRQIWQALHEGGAKIVFGSDATQAFNVPGFSIHREMALYVELGMTPFEVLEAATRRPAEYFDAVDEFGMVAEGHRANLLLLTANPLEDIGNVGQRAGVMLDGRFFPEAEIQLRLEEVARFYGN